MGTDGKLTISIEAGTTADVLTPRHYAWSDPRYGFIHPSIVDTNADLPAALRGEAAAATTGDDNLKTMKLLFAALRSTASNTVLQLGTLPCSPHLCWQHRLPRGALSGDALSARRVDD